MLGSSPLSPRSSHSLCRNGLALTTPTRSLSTRPQQTLACAVTQQGESCAIKATRKVLNSAHEALTSEQTTMLDRQVEVALERAFTTEEQLSLPGYGNIAMTYQAGQYVRALTPRDAPPQKSPAAAFNKNNLLYPLDRPHKPLVEINAGATQKLTHGNCATQGFMEIVPIERPGLSNSRKALQLHGAALFGMACVGGQENSCPGLYVIFGTGIHHFGGEGGEGIVVAPGIASAEPKDWQKEFTNAPKPKSLQDRLVTFLFSRAAKGVEVPADHVHDDTRLKVQLSDPLGILMTRQTTEDGVRMLQGQNFGFGDKRFYITFKNGAGEEIARGYLRGITETHLPLRAPHYKQALPHLMTQGGGCPFVRV